MVGSSTVGRVGTNVCSHPGRTVTTPGRVPGVNWSRSGGEIVADERDPASAVVDHGPVVRALHELRERFPAGPDDDLDVVPGEDLRPVVLPAAEVEEVVDHLLRIHVVAVVDEDLLLGIPTEYGVRGVAVVHEQP